MAQVICAGEVFRLHRITNGETEIFAGPVDSSSADGNGRTTLQTTIGTVRFYWGKPTQVQDSILAALQLDLGSGVQGIPMPTWKNVCYCVGDGLAFGSQVSPPTLVFEIERRLNLLSLSSHDIGGGAVLPEIIYDFLTNTLYGRGIPTSKIDTASFVAAAEAVITEGLGVSPFVDEATTLRDLLGGLMPYIDCFLYFKDGKIFMRLVRKESSAGAPVLDESSMTDEPKPTNDGWQETWNFTGLKFTDRENGWQESALEPYDDCANAAIVGEMVPRELDFKFVTTRAVAKVLARRKGITAGIPAMFWELTLLPSYRNTLVAGQLVKVSFAKRGISQRLMRIVEMSRGEPGSQEIKIRAMEEQTRDESHDYSPPNDTFGVTQVVDPTGGAAFTLVDTTPRLSWLTTELKAGAPDGVLVVGHRPNNLIDGFHLWFTWDPAKKAYQHLTSSTGFPAKGVVKCWHRTRNNTAWMFRLEVAQDFDRRMLDAMVDKGDDFYFAVGRRLFKATGSTINQHQVDALWLKKQKEGFYGYAAATILNVEVTDAAFGSTALALETTAGQGNYPTEHVYGGRRADFMIFTTNTLVFEENVGGAPLLWRPGSGTSNADTAKVRYIKTPVFNFAGEQSVSAVTAATYDRDLTTMSPNGTYSNEWGARVPTTYELFDDAGGAAVQGGTHPDYANLSDLDEDLSAELWGFSNDDQVIRIGDIDEVLGFMVLTSISHYNKTY